ncbi:MAG: hypothetical protein AAGG00_18950 [Cyanobacteria bacterium P01_H01_bin.150]
MALKKIQDQSRPCLVVFIHIELPIDSEAIALLEDFSVSGITAQRDVFTATLSSNAVSQLSEQLWVKSLKLSQQLRLSSGD